MAADLLPHCPSEFSSERYWSSFFAKRKQAPFEWYGDYDDLKDLFEKYLKPSDMILNIGCGNSTLTEILFDVGYRSIENVDISSTVVKQMVKRNSKLRPSLVFSVMDVKNLDYPDSSFQVILDKGTTDAMLSGHADSVDKENEFDRIFDEIDRTLCVGGRFLCITLAQSYIIHALLRAFFFNRSNYIIRAHKVLVEKSFVMPTFMLVFMKMKHLPISLPRVLEVNLRGPVIKCKSPEDFTREIESVQQLHFLTEKMQNNSTDDELYVDMMENGSVKYRCYVVNHILNSHVKRGYYAVFLCPAGREDDWLYRTVTGRKKLVQEHIKSYHRVLVVLLNSAFQYGDQKAIESDLNPRVMAFAPAGIPADYKTPYLSLNSQEISQANVVDEFESEISGKMLVVEVSAENYDSSYKIRRLIFKSNAYTSQTEALIESDGDILKTTLPVDVYFLLALISCNLHDNLPVPEKTHSSTELEKKLEESKDEKLMKKLSIGLGGGCLPSFLAECDRRFSQTVVELDRTVVDAAKQHFGFVEDDFCECLIEDGREFVSKFAKSIKPCDRRFDLIVVDVNAVDSASSAEGLSCPSREFFEPAFLKDLSTIVAPNSGVVLYNLCCRNPDKELEIVKTCRKAFPHVGRIQVKDYVNCVLVLSNQALNETRLLDCSKMTDLFDASRVKDIVAGVKF